MRGNECSVEKQEKKEKKKKGGGEEQAEGKIEMCNLFMHTAPASPRDTSWCYRSTLDASVFWCFFPLGLDFNSGSRRRLLPRVNVTGVKSNRSPKHSSNKGSRKGLTGNLQSRCWFVSRYGPDPNFIKPGRVQHRPKKNLLKFQRIKIRIQMAGRIRK